MIVKECIVDVLEDVLFVSTEFGNEYHSYGFIGNTAIPYAIGFVPVNYKQFTKPMHRDHFRDLVNRGIYITPLTFAGNVAFKIERFNCMPDQYNLTWKEDPSALGGRTVNYPDEGWFKFIRRGNRGSFFTISQHDDVPVPTYIRVGKFMSKCKITSTNIDHPVETGVANANIILRAEDMPSDVSIIEHEKMPVQHGMYLKNCIFKGRHVALRSKLLGAVNIPVNSSFYAALGGAVA